MARVKRGVFSRARRKKLLKAAKGYYNRNKNCFSIAKQKVEKGGQYAYRDRKNKKRAFRALWIIRLNAALRNLGLKYSVFINMLKKQQCDLNRKVLADLAMNHHDVFKNVVSQIASNSK